MTRKGDQDRSTEGPVDPSESENPPDPPTINLKIKRIADAARHERFVDQCLQLTAERLQRRKDPTSGPGIPDPNRAYNDREI